MSDLLPPYTQKHTGAISDLTISGYCACVIVVKNVILSPKTAKTAVPVVGTRCIRGICLQIFFR